MLPRCPAVLKKKPLISVGCLMVTAVVVLLPSSPSPDAPSIARPSIPSHVVTTLRLPLFLEDVTPSEEESNIYQIVTSVPESLTPRQYCSLESFCRKNSKSSVWFLLLGTSILQNEPSLWLRVLQHSYNNLRLANLDLMLAVKDTPLEDIVRSGKLRSSMYLPNHLSDVVRLAVVSKAGGLYADSDFICLRSLADIKNTMALETPDRLINEIFHFSRGHPLLQLIMEDDAANFNARDWGQNGPLLFSRTAKKNCPQFNFLVEQLYPPSASGNSYLGRLFSSVFGSSDTDASSRGEEKLKAAELSEKGTLMETSEGACHNVTLMLDPLAFMPINISFVDKFFEKDSAEYLSQISRKTYGLHLFNQYTKKLTIENGAKSAAEELFKKRCPVVYDTANRNSIPL